VTATEADIGGRCLTLCTSGVSVSHQSPAAFSGPCLFVNEVDLCTACGRPISRGRLQNHYKQTKNPRYLKLYCETLDYASDLEDELTGGPWGSSSMTLDPDLGRDLDDPAGSDSEHRPLPVPDEIG
jgi:hypothetical protein